MTERLNQWKYFASHGDIPLRCKGGPIQKCLSNNREFIGSCNWKVQDLIFGRQPDWKVPTLSSKIFFSPFLFSALFGVDFICNIFPSLSLTSLATQVEKQHCFPPIAAAKSCSWLSLDQAGTCASPECPYGQRDGKCAWIMCSSTGVVGQALQEPHGLRRGRNGFPEANQHPSPEEGE